VKRLVDERPLILLEESYANWTSSFGYAENVAAAIGVAATHPKAVGEVYNVMDDTVHDTKGWATAFATALNWPCEIRLAPAAQLPQHLTQALDFIDFSQDLLVDASKIRCDLGYKDPVGFEEAILRTADYEQQSLDEADLKDFDYDAEDAAFRQLLR